MQMDPGRVESIQQALISAGAFHGSPTGRWDSETHDAMARYQAANGFGVTGLPDAKSLMKLGLGPHPLPPALNKSQAPGAEPEAAPGNVPPPGADSPASVPAPPSTVSTEKGDPPTPSAGPPSVSNH
jgi:peptidoglycan hydrolase-like protein with peptidoglycan-binding domain